MRKEERVMSSIHNETFYDWYREMTSSYKGERRWINMIGLDTVFRKMGRLRVPHENLREVISSYFSLGLEENVAIVIITKKNMICGASTNNSVILAKSKIHPDIAIFGVPSTSLNIDMGKMVVQNIVTSVLWELKDDKEDSPKLFDADSINSIVYDKQVSHYTSEILCSFGRGSKPDYMDIMKAFSDMKHLTMALHKHLDR